MLPFSTLDCYCGFHKPKTSAVTTCYIRKDASERFPRFSSFISLCDLLIGANVGRDIKKVEKHCYKSFAAVRTSSGRRKQHLEVTDWFTYLH